MFRKEQKGHFEMNLFRITLWFANQSIERAGQCKIYLGAANLAQHLDPIISGIQNVCATVVVFVTSSLWSWVSGFRSFECPSADSLLATALQSQLDRCGPENLAQACPPVTLCPIERIFILGVLAGALFGTACGYFPYWWLSRTARGPLRQ